MRKTTRKRRRLFPALILLTLLVCLPKVLPVLGEEMPVPVSTVSAADQCQAQRGAEPQETPETSPEPEASETPEVPADMPDGVLFIGDSRTVGLQEYSGLTDADFFCETGMSVYNLFDAVGDQPELGGVTLETLLDEKRYGRIHLMLGINELGYDFDATVETYKAAVDRILALQPDAVVYLGANLHVTQARSDTDTLYNNPNIDRFNQAVSQMADGARVRYLDVNALFDKDGALDAAKTGDGVHVYGACYMDWGEWLLEAMGITE